MKTFVKESTGCSESEDGSENTWHYSNPYPKMSGMLLVYFDKIIYGILNGSINTN